MPPTYRVRYSLTSSGFPRAPGDTQVVEVKGGLEQVPGQLPPGAYIMYIEDLAAGRDVHWTQWPKAFRPGFGEEPKARPHA